MSTQFSFDLAGFVKHLAKEHRQISRSVSHLQILNRIAGILGFHDQGKMITTLQEVTYQNADSFRTMLPNQQVLTDGILKELSLDSDHLSSLAGENEQYYAEYLYLLRGHSILRSSDKPTPESLYCFPNAKTIQFDQEIAKPFFYLKSSNYSLVLYTPVRTFSPVAASLSEVYPTEEYVEHTVQFVRALREIFPYQHFTLPGSEVNPSCLQALDRRELGKFYLKPAPDGALLLIGPEVS